MLAYQMAQEGKEMITAILTIALIIALLKWYFLMMTKVYTIRTSPILRKNST